MWRDYKVQESLHNLRLNQNTEEKVEFRVREKVPHSLRVTSLRS